MPVIPTERYGRKTGVNPAVLLAIMAFPKDEEERRHYLLSLHTKSAGQMEDILRRSPDFEPDTAGRMIGEMFGRLLAPLGGFSSLNQAPSYEEMLRRVGSNAWPGSIAGSLLNNLIQMRAAGIDASVNKAIAIELEVLAGLQSSDGGPGGGRTERYVRQAWEDFKPACHLWAAREILSREGERSADPQLDADGLLALSDVLLKLALTIQPKRSREPLLRPGEMWQLPRRYKHRRVLARFTIPPLEDWKVEILQREFKSTRP